MTHSSRHGDPGLWLGLSIAATLMCCLPLGIPGIVYAARAMSDQSRGDWAASEESVRLARLWTLWSAGVTIGGIALLLCIGPAGSLLSNY